MATSKSISHILSPEGPNNLFSVDFGSTTIKSIMNSITNLATKQKKAWKVTRAMVTPTKTPIVRPVRPQSVIW